MEENKVVAAQDQGYSFNDQWTKPNIKIGRLTIIVAIICSFLPNIYLYIVHGAAPGFSVAMAAWAAIASAYAAFWIVEPISYGTVFGTTGTYISVLTGSMAQMRLPASATAQDAAGVEADSPQADVISVLGNLRLSHRERSGCHAFRGCRFVYRFDSARRGQSRHYDSGPALALRRALCPVCHA